jgi:hypothetical protein
MRESRQEALRRPGEDVEGQQEASRPNQVREEVAVKDEQRAAREAAEVLAKRWGFSLSQGFATGGKVYKPKDDDGSGK